MKRHLKKNYGGVANLCGTGMTNVRTFVFLDLETTGLPWNEWNRTKITELSMVACSKQHLLESISHLPRVLHKLSLCFNPSRMISHGSSLKTGLYNDLLQYEGKFDSSAGEMVKIFLKRLQKPICFVAHNGYRFDFILLKKQLASLDVQLEGPLVCIDTLPAFRAIEADLQRSFFEHNEGLDSELVELEYEAICVMEKLERESSEKSSSSTRSTTLDEQVERNYKQALHSYLNLTPEGSPNRSLVEADCPAPQLCSTAIKQEDDALSALYLLVGAECSVNDHQKRNETTPGNRHTKSRNAAAKETSFTESQTQSSLSATKVSAARKRLFNEPDQNAQNGSIKCGTQLNSGKPTRRGYSLSEIYKRTMGKELVSAHQAEGDVVALIECVIVHADRFVRYAEANCVPYEDIKENF
ncbi:uncharacterized protein LOC128278364 isoform X2 [Anopheles cruzii]|uniref:uncharacterized protein LOC128278364 isoform X2 n=1 Tax=Anopheles cruzii TaxID=68878 RepID=UPI0022EC41A6|nr:uncharacterized protein LOC128278364 isoform X2 [Anopheles cruzii]